MSVPRASYTPVFPIAQRRPHAGTPSDLVAELPSPTTRTTIVRRRDPDGRKGAMEQGRPWVTTNAPGLDDDGLPNDETAIAEDAIGAREDGSQG
jgi:hypothetical protein